LLSCEDVAVGAHSAAVVGRFAPSPTGQLHLGNLRTALVAYLSTVAQGGRFIVRFEDLDRVTSRAEHEHSQLTDLAAIGLDWESEVVRQSERFEIYDQTIDRLRELGRVYDCFCSRREIREAATAPHGDLPDGAYPGTCRQLTQQQRRAHVEAGRQPAQRLLTYGERFAFVDGIAGETEGGVDDVVLRRNDGVPAYNLAVVVDDSLQGVTEVVRGDDLLSSTPRQLLLIDVLGFDRPRYAHVPLVLATDGSRLAKRHGAVTLAELGARGPTAADIRDLMAVSLGLAEPGDRSTIAELAERFSLTQVHRQPWVVDPSLIG
jgi:glutamyl-tRNA synthetase